MTSDFPLSHVETGAAIVPRVSTWGKGMALGVLLFAIQNLGVWSAYLAPPPGYQPLGYVLNFDNAQYLGFLGLAPTHGLLPDLHAPWKTEPGMLNALFWTAGRAGGWLGLTPVATLNLLGLAMYLLAGVTFVYALRAFLPTRRQRRGALAVTLCALPILMHATSLARFLAPAADYLFQAGIQQLAYASADGLLRGGLSNSPTLSFGTATMLAGLAFTGLRVRTGRKAFTAAIAATAFLSGLVHPFEVFVIVPASIVAILWLERKVSVELLWIAGAAALGVAPQLYLLQQHRWMWELSQVFNMQGSVREAGMLYGLPFLAVPYLIFMRARPRTKADKVLLIWWLVTLGVLSIPKAPFPPHLLDGFAVVTGILVVRLAAGDPKLQAIYARSPRGFQVAAALPLFAALAAYVGMYAQLAKDARMPDPEFQLTAVASDAQMKVIERFRGLKRPGDLVLAPLNMAMLLVQAPMHSFASHEHLSFNFARQRSQADKFLAGGFSKPEADALLRDYGIRWVVLPRESQGAGYFSGRAPRFEYGNWLVFELPGHQMEPYPGVARMRFEPL